MKYWEEVLAGLKKHFHHVTVRGKADFIVSDWNREIVLPKTTKVKIGGTTYIVSSYFKKDARSNVSDKVARLIERDAENLPDD